MTIEYLAIYGEPLDQTIEEQLMQYCSEKPCIPASEATLKNVEIICGAIYKAGIRLFWFRDPNAVTMLKLFESNPIYIGQFDAMTLSRSHSFQRPI
jgi:hypothetical protein